MRRVRATFLLRCVTLASCLAVFAGALALGNTLGWSVGALLCLAVFWFLGIEAGLLPLAIERVAIRRAAGSGTRVSSIWFADLDQNLDREAQDFQDDTRDNPTIR